MSNIDSRHYLPAHRVLEGCTMSPAFSKSQVSVYVPRGQVHSLDFS